MEITPFDIPPEEPALPQGDSHSLPRTFFNISEPAPRPTPEQIEQRLQEQDERNEALRNAPSEAHMMEIGQLSARDQELVLHWWPQVFYRPSQFIDQPVVFSVQHVLAHAKGMRKQGYKLPTSSQPVVTQNAFAQAHMAWIKECSLRKAWIEQKRIEWQKRKAERDKVLADVKAQWDPYVDEAYKTYKVAEAYPVPERPVKA